MWEVLKEEMMIEMMIGMALAKDKSLGQLQTHDLMLVPQVNDLAAGTTWLTDSYSLEQSQE